MKAAGFIEDVLTKNYLRTAIKKWGGVQYTPLGFPLFKKKELPRIEEESENIWRHIAPKRRFYI